MKEVGWHARAAERALTPSGVRQVSVHAASTRAEERRCEAQGGIGSRRHRAGRAARFTPLGGASLLVLLGLARGQGGAGARRAGTGPGKARRPLVLVGSASAAARSTVCKFLPGHKAPRFRKTRQAAPQAARVPRGCGRGASPPARARASLLHPRLEARAPHVALVALEAVGRRDAHHGAEARKEDGQHDRHPASG